MSDPRLIEIEVLLDNKPFATRYWSAVPRIGESITLRDPATNTQFLARVKDIQWNEHARALNAIAQQLVHLSCETNRWRN